MIRYIVTIKPNLKRNISTKIVYKISYLEYWYKVKKCIDYFKIKCYSKTLFSWLLV